MAVVAVVLGILLGLAVGIGVGVHIMYEFMLYVAASDPNCEVFSFNGMLDWLRKQS